MKTQRRTKIVCTIGPSSSSEERIRELVLAGMDVARLNFSHGTHSEHREAYGRLRRVSDQLGKNLAVMLDLQGPKIRCGAFQGGKPVLLSAGQEFTITTQAVEGDATRVSTTYEKLPQDVKPGDRLLLADGAIELRALGTTESDVRCEVVTGGLLGDHKGINLPGVAISTPSLTAKDEEDVRFGVELGIDYIALSFVRSAGCVRTLRRLLDQLGSSVPIVAKIEKPEALQDIDAILAEVNGIMVARGDLGVELPPEQVPQVQKDLIAKCNKHRIPVITATQMLESMISSPRPTRAEASDVANAIYDGTDALMLSAETAIGKYPVEAVKIMARIAEETDRAVSTRSGGERLRAPAAQSVADAVGSATCQAARGLGAAAIVCFTMSGSTARLISSYRPPARIVAATRNKETMRRLAVYWGVEATSVRDVKNTDEMVAAVDERLLELGLAARGDIVIITAGTPLMVPGTTNLMKVHRVGEFEKTEG